MDKLPSTRCEGIPAWPPVRLVCPVQGRGGIAGPSGLPHSYRGRVPEVEHRLEKQLSSQNRGWAGWSKKAQDKLFCAAENNENSFP